MAVRGVRGATVVKDNTPEDILRGTRELLEAVVGANPSLDSEQVVSVIFTVTDDLDAAYPAKAARQIGWDQVPLLCSREIAVPGSLPKCVRVLLHWNTDLHQSDIRHVYLGEAANLRPDITKGR
jgi:chorismate mutase